jgi:hypothetical protein
MVMDDSAHGLKCFLVEAPPVIRLLQIAKEPAISAPVIGSQHPTDARPEFAFPGKNPDQTVLSEIVDIADVLILHGTW